MKVGVTVLNFILKCWRIRLFIRPFGKNRAYPKTRFFSMMHVTSHRILLDCIVYPLTYQIFMPLNGLVFTLRSKVDLIWIRAIQPLLWLNLINIDFCQEIRNVGHCTRFWDGVADRESAHQLLFLRFLREEWGEF